MLFKLSLPFLALLLTAPWPSSSAAKTPAKSCSCWSGYKAEHTKTGPQCVSTDAYHIMPCDMPHPPGCRCTGAVSNILKDRTGTWCTRYTKGEELMRWPCENREEWVEFFKRHPDLL